MEKRGQATIFIIVGVVIIILVALVIFLKGEIIIGKLSPQEQQKFLTSKLEPINNQIRECIQDLGFSYVTSLGLRGGDIDPNFAALYKGENVQYLCYRDSGVGSCIQNILTIKDMQGKLNGYLEASLGGCINLESFESGRFVISAGALAVSSEINDNNIQVVLDYPISLVSDDARANLNMFSEVLDMPLGKLHGLSIDIINSEVAGEYFDNVGYMVENRGDVIVERHKPYPDTVYVLSDRDSGFVFQFAIEGEETV